MAANINENVGEEVAEDDLDPGLTWQQGSKRDCILKGFVICVPPDGKIEKNEMGGTYGT